MANYIDGFVVPVPKRKLAAYRSMARRGAKVWKEHGALEYVESIADDVSWGKRTSFQRAVKMNRRSETVVFSYIVYKSKGDRDRIMKKVMSDPRMKDMMDMKKLPFDAKRMIYGGFRAMVEMKGGRRR
jgi:uncharacterized protein YbaA (DUF1428 family)